MLHKVTGVERQVSVSVKLALSTNVVFSW